MTRRARQGVRCVLKGEAPVLGIGACIVVEFGSLLGGEEDGGREGSDGRSRDVNMAGDEG